jgi:hypothetical protein
VLIGRTRHRPVRLWCGVEVEDTPHLVLSELRPASELTHGLPSLAGYLRQLLGAEHDQRDQGNDQQMDRA